MNTIGGLSSLFKTGSDDQDDEESKREKELTCTKGSLETEFGMIVPQVFYGWSYYGSTVTGVEQQREAGDGESGGVERGESGEGERGDSDKSEDEDVCPICLNELDEGEDLITCRRCVNRLHQHCMDICEWEIETELITVLCTLRCVLTCRGRRANKEERSRTMSRLSDVVAVLLVLSVPWPGWVAGIPPGQHPCWRRRGGREGSRWGRAEVKVTQSISDAALRGESPYG